ncbi:MAG TPA: hypothetical protein VD994_03830 [Prosthecobacter sp.]|nr:hypothetical protein [Prosthecobacter sp.]
MEVLFDAASVLRWRDPQAALPAVLTAAAQKAVIDNISRQAGEWCQVQSAGKPLPGAFIGADIIKGRPANTLPFEEGAELALDEAMVGLTWEFPTPSAPEDLTLSWRGFVRFPAAATIPVTVFFGPGSERLTLSTAQPQATWQSQGRVPEVQPLTEVPAVPVESRLGAVWVYVGLGLAGVALVYFILLASNGWPAPNRGVLIGIAWAIAVAGIVGKSLRKADLAPAVKTPQQAEAILQPLLRNVYRAFDHRAEGEIYDVLARSVHGGLLRMLYLETIQALTLEGREGTRVTITDFDATVTAVRPAAAGNGFTADCQWTALGRVGHWGHTHTRVNRYTAQVTVTPEGKDAERAWKITALEVTEARRL